jgi:hypothetical protein
VTSFANDFITVTWQAPDNGGAEITAYSIFFRESDGTSYSLELSECDGSQPAIISALSCSVNSYTLHEAPFSLPWGTDVHAKV